MWGYSVWEAGLAVSPGAVVSGTGLNLSARQLGGALAIAVAASLVAARPDGAGYDRAWLLCATTGVLAALAGLALAVRR